MNSSWNQWDNCNTRTTRNAGPRTRWETTEAALLLILALLVFFWAAVFGGRVLLPADLIFDNDPLWQSLTPEGYTHPSNPALSDQVYQFYPWKVFTLHSFAQGQLPLWNPYVCAGLPFVGNAQSAVFSPFNLLSYLLPSRQPQLYLSYVVTAILRLFVAGIFTYLFAREIGLNVPGALLATIAFTFSGPMIVWVGYPLSSVVVWLPAMLLTIERALGRKNRPGTGRGLYVAASGLTIAAQFLGSHPETFFQVMLAWTTYSLYRAVVLEGWQPSRLLPQLLTIAIAASIGALLAAVQLLPFAEALLQSATLATRQAGAASRASPFFTHLLLEWHEWPTAITAFLPQYFGSSLDGSYWFPYSHYVEQNTYTGVLPLALAATVTFHEIRHYPSPHRNLVLFFALMAMVYLGIALRLPLLNAVNYLPPFNVVANGRLRIIYVFAIAILAGLGLDEISSGHRSPCRTTLRILILLALISLFLIVLAYVGFAVFKDEVIRSGRAFMESRWGTPYFSRPLEYYYALVEERYEKKLALFRPSNIVMYLPVLIALTWFALHRRSQRQHIGTKVWSYTALSLTLLDLFLVGMPFNPTITPQQIFPTPGAIQFLKQDHDIYRVSGTDLILNPNSGMVFGISDIRGYDAVVPQRYTDLVSRLEGHYRLHFHSLFVQADSPVFDLLNVKYVLTDQRLDGKWKLAYEDAGSVKVYRNTDVLPRAFVVYRAEIVDNATQSLERVTDSTFNFRKRAVLEEMPAGWTEPLEVPDSTATVQITDYQPNQIRLRVETAADGLLVLTDTYAPGWKPLLDGHLAPVFVADHAFRAVGVPTGTHQVEFVYEPRGFRVGAMVSLVTMAALALVPLIARIRCARDSGR
jgi:hypothetical protein